MSRLAVCAVLFAASCLLIAQPAGPVVADDKKDKVTTLEKQVAALKTELQTATQQNTTLTASLQTAAQQNATLKTSVTQVESKNATLAQEVAALKKEVDSLKATNNRLNSIIKRENIPLPASDQLIRSLQTALDGMRGAGLVHVVVLKLKSDTSPGEGQAVIDDAYAQLAAIKPVRGIWAGKPTSKGTPDSNSDYTVALVVLFDDAAGLKAYLNDPAHTQFADKHLKKWETPTVYDYEPKKFGQ